MSNSEIVYTFGLWIAILVVVVLFRTTPTAISYIILLGHKIKFELVGGFIALAVIGLVVVVEIYRKLRKNNE